VPGVLVGLGQVLLLPGMALGVLYTRSVTVFSMLPLKWSGGGFWLMMLDKMLLLLVNLLVLLLNLTGKIK